MAKSSVFPEFFPMVGCEKQDMVFQGWEFLKQFFDLIITIINFRIVMRFSQSQNALPFVFDFLTQQYGANQRINPVRFYFCFVVLVLFQPWLSAYVWDMGIEVM